MWFDAHSKLAEIAGGTPATSATTATQAPAARPVSQMSQVSQPPAPEMPPEELARDLHEARARVAALADPDGVARTPAAIAAVWDEAEATARIHHHERTTT